MTLVGHRGRLFLAAGISLILFGCLPPRVPTPAPQTQATPTPTPSAAVPPVADQTAIFYVLHPEGNPDPVAKLLSKSPTLHLTLVFPAHYFDVAERRPTIPNFRVLQSSGQIETILTLENEPNLPLLGNLQMAFKGTTPWNVNFSWPEDIAGQIARGSGHYQKRWNQLPSGFFPPYLELSDQVVKSLQRFRLSYVLAKPQLDWGARSVGPTMILVPPLQPVSTLAEGTVEWADELAAWTLSHPFSLIDSTSWKNPESEMAFLNSLAKLVQQKPFPFETHRGEDLQSYIVETHLLPSSQDAFTHDFSDWIRSSQQRGAWQALAEARRVLETYKNSGRAVLPHLDAAQEEMYNAESGAFLLSLGQTLESLPTSEKNFIATVANVYRHTNTPVPDNLNRLFAYKKTMALEEKTSLSDEPFFEPGDKTMIWNDPAADDFGSGGFRYPYGNYPAGTFDLKRFSIRWTDDYVTFSVGLVGSLPSESVQSILPMTDIYIDVNRLAGAGNQDSLPGRGSVAVDRNAAWEYALSLGQTTAALYQSLPGKEPRKVGIFTTTTSPETKTFSVSVPLMALRGDPSEWRLSVALGGMEQSKQSEEPLPIPVLAQPSAKNFGGAIGGRSAPHFIDLLDSSIDDQKAQMQAYESGRKVVLPFVEAP